jgi:hypothetical protein
VVATDERNARFKAMSERWGPPSETDEVGGTAERYYGASGISLIAVTHLNGSPVKPLDKIDEVE